MATIGETLREAREQLGLTLEEAEHATRIRTHHLQALENEAWDSLPSPVQARGFLHNYADFLGLDAERRPAPVRRRPPAAPRRTSRRRRRIAASTDSDHRGRRPQAPLDLVGPRHRHAGRSGGHGACWAGACGRVMAGFRERTLADAAGPSPHGGAWSRTAVPTEPLPDGLAQGPAPLRRRLTPTLAPPPILAAIGTGERAVGHRTPRLGARPGGRRRAVCRPSGAWRRPRFPGADVDRSVIGNGGGVRAFYQGEDTGLMGEFG